MRSIVKIIRGVASLLGYMLNTLFWCIPLFIVALLKLIIPLRSFRSQCNRLLSLIASGWVAINTLNQRLLSKTTLKVQGPPDYSLEKKYLVVANHQSWVDILVLQRIFHRRIPFLKFFIKKELRWFPLLGQAWWALDFPFMKRYSPAKLKKYPHLKGKDLIETKKACEKYRTMPVSVMNFVEGTRFSPGKHERQQSPFENLLKPKAGGTAFVLSAMGDQISTVVDVTIVYPQGAMSLWDFLCGRVDDIGVTVRTFPVTEDMQGDYNNDSGHRQHIQEWLNHLWKQKDQMIKVELEKSPGPATGSVAAKEDAHPSLKN